MNLMLDLPDGVVRRLTAEAERRGARIVDVIADLAAQLPPAETGARRKLAFVGVGASGTGITPHIDELLADGFGQD
jgi:hypothetical protein